jgi:periplasmic protein TonB
MATATTRGRATGGGWMRRGQAIEESSRLSPLGALLAEIREAQHLDHSAAGKHAPMRVGSQARLEPVLSLETRVVTHPSVSAKGWFVPASVVLHVSVLAGAILIPLFRPEVLPESATLLRVSFAEPRTLSPPPPPAPTPRHAHVPVVATVPRPPESSHLTAPVAVPEKVEPEAGLDAGGEGGETGGAEGGIPGGVVGGIVGGLPQASSPPTPIRIEGQMKEPTKLKHVAPIYPDLAAGAGIQGAVVLECLVSPQGRVTEVKILNGIPLLNEAAVAAVKQWLYTPTLLDGVPVPVIMTVTVQFSLKGARSARAP